MLIHWPGTAKISLTSPKNAEKRKETWQALERLQSESKVRFIGVSNFTIKHLQEMESYATVMPYVNQFEIHPLCYDVELIEYCRTKNIRVQVRF